MQRKTILITGATGGIGRVVSRQFAEAGMNVVLFSRTEEKLAKLASTFNPEQVLVVRGDATSHQDIEGAFGEGKKHFGTVDAVLMSVGTWDKVGIDTDPAEALRKLDIHYDTIFKSAFITSQVAQRFFRSEGQGYILNISSHAAHKPELKGNLTYGSMKAGGSHLMEALRYELDGTDIRITDLRPATVNTEEMRVYLDTPEKQAQAVQPEEIGQWVIDNFDNPYPERIKNFECHIVL